MSENYTSYLQTICTMLVATTTDPNFTAVLQAGMDYAELRCYRDLDLLNTVVRDTGPLTAGNRNFGLPSANFSWVVVDQINVITPATVTTPDLGTRNPLMPVSGESVNYTYPSVNGSGVPTTFAMVTQTSIVVAPWPDQAYTIEVQGTMRPTSLYTTQSTSLLSVFFPDLFVAASMVWFTGWQRDFGQQATDPTAGASWEQQYQVLLKSSQVEEARKRFRAEGWSSKSPSQIATPPRT